MFRRQASLLLALALWASITPAQQSLVGGANLFAPSSQAGKAIDAERALPLTTFYSNDGVKTAAPGTLVRSKPATDFALPPGVTVTRILYHTRTAGGKDVLSSGVVLVPYGEGLYEYILMGYAVVATDYAGLGTEGRHAYLDMLSNGTDVIHSVPAAHAAVPNLSEKWLVIGHSQGGLSTLGVAQIEAGIKDPNFLGTVALAGASDLQDGLDSMLGVKLPVLNGLMGFWIYGVKSVYPELDLKDVLTPKALAIYNSSVEDRCSAASGASRLFRPMKCCCPTGTTTNTSSNSSRATSRESNPPTVPYSSSAAETTSFLPNPPAERSFNAFVVPGYESSGMFTPVSARIRLFSAR